MIHFSITADVADIHTVDEAWIAELEVPTAGHGVARVEMRNELDGNNHFIKLKASAEFDFAEAEELFVDLAKGNLPAGSSLVHETLGDEEIIFDPPGAGDVELEQLPSWVLPPVMSETRETAGTILEAAALRAIGVLRWRYGVRGAPEPLEAVRLVWSTDGVTWLRWHPEFRATAYALMPIQGHVSQIELQALLDSYGSEPLGHALLREAKATADSFPRSAYLLAVSAAEIGVKAFISERAPDAEWLAFEAPSPPLVKMIRQYLPQIDGDPYARGRSVRVPPAVYKPLARAVEIRNRIAHKDADESEAAEDLESCLDAVSDLLWLLDAARGFEWAILRVSHEALVELGIV